MFWITPGSSLLQVGVVHQNARRSDNSIFDSSKYEIVLLCFDGPSDLKRMLVEPIVDRYLEKYNRRFEVYHKILHAEITT